MNIICAVTGCEEQATSKPYYIAENVYLNLCQPHNYDVATRTKQRARQAIADLDAIGGISKHTPGWTYIVRMSDGSVKIGTSGKGVAERFKALTTRYNAGIPVYVLAVVEGGESRERLYHHRWMSLRIPGTMEAFHADPSILRWAEELGIDPSSDVGEYEGYVERKDGRHTQSEYAREMFGITTEEGEEESAW